MWENGGENGRSNTADFLSGMAQTLPPMMQVMKDIGGVELPEALIKLSEAGESVDASDEESAGKPPKASSSKLDD